MTLVACLKQNVASGLVADALITTKKRGDPIQNMPMLDGKLMPMYADGQNYTVVDLRRKIVFISPKLVVGWSGPAKQAADIINKMKKYFFGGEKIDDIIHFLNSIASEDSKKVSLLGINIENNIPKVFGFGQYRSCNTRDYSIYAIGGGAKSGINVTQNMGYSLANNTKENTPIDILCCSYLGSLLLKEFETLKSISELYGGAYEMVCPIKEGSEIVLKGSSEITHLICFFDKNIGHPYFPVIFKQWYHDNNLIVTRICPQNTEINGMLRFTEGYRHFVCPSILSGKEDLQDTINNLSYLPDMYSMYINLYGFGVNNYNGMIVNKNSDQFHFDHSNLDKNNKLLNVWIHKEKTKQLQEILSN